MVLPGVSPAGGRTSLSELAEVCPCNSVFGLGMPGGDPRPLGCLPVLSSEHQEEGRSSQARGGPGMSRETPSPWGCVRLWRLQSPGTTNCSAEKQNCRLETLEVRA